MDTILSPAGLFMLLQIIIIDILLAGDNAIVIGMAAKRLPRDMQKKAIFCGTAGAIILRVVMSLLFLEALTYIPALHLVGGLLLLWIGYSLLNTKKEEHNIQAKDTLWSAIGVIVVADGIMSIDNVLGVVAAAKGHVGLVLIGLLVTVPIIIWGSTLFIKLIERFPIILYFGGALLGWVGATMICEDGLIKDYVEPYRILIGILCMVIVVGAAMIRNRMAKGKEASSNG